MRPDHSPTDLISSCVMHGNFLKLCYWQCWLVNDTFKRRLTLLFQPQEYVSSSHMYVQWKFHVSKALYIRISNGSFVVRLLWHLLDIWCIEPEIWDILVLCRKPRNVLNTDLVHSVNFNLSWHYTFSQDSLHVVEYACLYTDTYHLIALQDFFLIWNITCYIPAVFFLYIRRIFKNIFSHAEQISQVLICLHKLSNSFFFLVKVSSNFPKRSHWICKFYLFPCEMRSHQAYARVCPSQSPHKRALVNSSTN